MGLNTFIWLVELVTRGLSNSNKMIYYWVEHLIRFVELIMRVPCYDNKMIYLGIEHFYLACRTCDEGPK